MKELIDILTKTVEIIHRYQGPECAHEYFLSLKNTVGPKISQHVFGNLCDHDPNQSYKVQLIKTGDRVIHQIKLYREYTGAGLADSKYMVEAAPCEFEIKGIRNALNYIDDVAEMGGEAVLLGETELCD